MKENQEKENSKKAPTKKGNAKERSMSNIITTAPFGQRVKWLMTRRRDIGNGFERTASLCVQDIFRKGKQTGEWTTYDKKGKVYKVTKMK